jgi:S-disulfanyl-L-cysteine oxidoreductase SoxD
VTLLRTRMMRSRAIRAREGRVKDCRHRLAAIWPVALIALITPLGATPRDAAPGSTQDSPSVWSGVYSAAQADRGKAIYAGHCGRCHGDDLGANRDYPLAGERFMDHWEARTLEHLFSRIRDSMPPGEAGTVNDDDKRDALAYLLLQNGFPAGSAEIPRDDAELATILIARKNGPGPLKTGDIVRVAGCLGQRREREWELTRAAEPERTALESTPGPGGRPPGAIPSGTGTVRLLNAFPRPAAHLGHTMQAIGFLVRDAAGDAVNVVSLEMLAPSCAP